MSTDDHTTDPASISTRLRTLIAEVLELPVDEVRETSRFIEDLDVDSLASLQLAVQVEKHFGVSISATHLGSIESVGDMLKAVEAQTAHQAGR